MSEPLKFERHNTFTRRNYCSSCTDNASTDLKNANETTKDDVANVVAPVTHNIALCGTQSIKNINKEK